MAIVGAWVGDRGSSGLQRRPSVPILCPDGVDDEAPIRDRHRSDLGRSEAVCGNGAVHPEKAKALAA
jgi:hypothetical protein